MNIEKLKNSKWLYFPRIIRRYFIDSKFRKWIKQYNGTDVLVFNKLGEENPDTNIYYMKYDDPSMGFFGYWKFIILGCSFADYYGLTPVVNWTDQSPYYEPSRFGEKSNPFEYYFEPLSSVDFISAENSRKVVMARISIDCSDDFKGYLPYDFKNHIDSYVKVHKKHIRIKSELNDQIESQIKKLLSDRKTAGVHIRGVEWGQIKDHPVPPDIQEYFIRVDEGIRMYGYEQIFIASDSDIAVKLFKERYGEKVISYEDVIRTSEGSSMLMLFDPSIERRDHRYLMGYEVLRDMLTLSFCDGLVAGPSNISLAAIVFKKARGDEYASLDLLPVKIATSGISSAEYVKGIKSRRNTY